jgi:hypothetical protein
MLRPPSDRPRPRVPRTIRAMSLQRDPDPDATIPDALGIQKAVTDCWAAAMAMAHDPLRRGRPGQRRARDAGSGHATPELGFPLQ